MLHQPEKKRACKLPPFLKYCLFIAFEHCQFYRMETLVGQQQCQVSIHPIFSNEMQGLFFNFLKNDAFSGKNKQPSDQR